MSDKKTNNKGPQGGFGGPMRQMNTLEKSKNFKGTMGKLLGFLKPYKVSIIVVIIFAIGSAAFSIVGPKFLGKATTK